MNSSHVDLYFSMFGDSFLLFTMGMILIMATDRSKISIFLKVIGYFFLALAVAIFGIEIWTMTQIGF